MVSHAPHATYLNKVCLLCFNKSKHMRELNSNLRNIIQESFVRGIDFEDTRFPKVLCSTCFTIVYQAGSGIFKRKIEIFDYSKLKPLKQTTRNSIISCDCIVCTIGSTVNFWKSHEHVSKKRKKGRPNKETSSVPCSVIQLCSFCFSKISKGISHVCTETAKVNNIQVMISTSEGKCSDQVLSHLLKDKSNNNNSTSLSLSQLRGKPLPIKLLSPSDANSAMYISHEQMKSIQKDLHMSQNQTKKLAQSLRSCTKKRHFIQSGLHSSLHESLHENDHLYEIKSLTIAGTKQTVVICCNIPQLIKNMKTSRNIQQEAKLLFKIGIDYGGAFLKVCMNMILLDREHTSRKRRRFTDSPSDKYKDTSVNKLLILAAVQEVKETYQSVKAIFDLLSLRDIEIFGDISIAADLKMANIIFGLMSHSSTHPCTWCTSLRYVICLFIFEYFLIENNSFYTILFIILNIRLILLKKTTAQA